MPLTDNTRALAQEIIARYPRPRSALLPMLHLVQSEEGYVTPEGIGLCAEELGLTKAEVGAVATFYTMYKRRPTGEYLVSVCTNTLCGMLGGDEIYASLSEKLGVGHNQTTGDAKITLEHAECLAACDFAPVVTVNYEYFDQQSEDSAEALVDALVAGERPLPTRGAPLCSFKEISRQLAGFIDDRPEARAAVSIGEPTLRGNRLAMDRGETAPGYDERPAPAPAEEAPKPAAPPTPEPTKAQAAAETPAEKSAADQQVGVPANAQQTSDNDAPNQTAESDPAAEAPQGAVKEDAGEPAEGAGAEAEAPVAEKKTGGRPSTTRSTRSRSPRTTKRKDG